MLWRKNIDQDLLSRREDQGEGIPSVLVVLVAGQSGEWRSRTAATVAGTPGLQRADAVPEMVARTLGPRWCSAQRGLLSGLRSGERREEIGRGRDEFRRWAEGQARPRGERRAAAALCGWIGRRKKKNRQKERGKKRKRLLTDGPTCQVCHSTNHIRTVPFLQKKMG